jgi:hypothetical protein
MNPQEVLKQLKSFYPKMKPLDILHHLLSCGDITPERLFRIAQEFDDEPKTYFFSEKHRELTRAVKSNSYWVHYNPATKMFMTWNHDDQITGITTDLGNEDIIKHSSKHWADEYANHPANHPEYVDFISVEVIEKTTFELA